MPATVEPPHLSESVTPEIAATTLYYYGERGTFVMEPGDWRTKLLDFAVKCDPMNRRRLARAFPSEVEAVQMADWPGGLDVLRVRAAEMG